MDIGTATVTAATKVGAISALITSIATDTDLIMVCVVGVVGGIAYVAKEFVVEEFKEQPIRTAINMLVSLLMAMSLTGFVFYAGKEGFNQHIKDVGTYVWIFLAFMCAINYKRVVSFLSNLIAIFLSRKAKGDD